MQLTSFCSLHQGTTHLVGNIGTTLTWQQLSRRIGRCVPIRLLPVSRAGLSVPEVRLSDHSPFWDAGFNAAMVADTSFLRNPNYHHMSDTNEGGHVTPPCVFNSGQ